MVYNLIQNFFTDDAFLFSAVKDSFKVAECGNGDFSKTQHWNRKFFSIAITGKRSWRILFTRKINRFSEQISWFNNNSVQHTFHPNRSGLFLDVKNNFDEGTQHIVQSIPCPNRAFNEFKPYIVRLVTKLRLASRYLWDDKFRHRFQSFQNPFCNIVRSTYTTTHFFPHWLD